MIEYRDRTSRRTLILDKELPEEHIEEIREILDRWEWILPSWVKELSICQAGSDPNSVLSITCRHRYRKATIDIRPEWHQWERKVREKMFLHELCHTTIAALADFAEIALKNLMDIDDPKTRTILGLLDEKIEETTEDLADTIWHEWKGI